MDGEKINLQSLVNSASVEGWDPSYHREDRMASADNTKLCMYGRRLRDGELFYVSYWIENKEEARVLFNSYLDPECRCSAERGTCCLHRKS
jgi:hypothetical protein